MKKIRISIIGSTGYSGKELIKILLNHRMVEIVHLISSTYAGKRLSEVFPEFLSQSDKILEDINLELITKDSDLIFTALPHTVSMELIPKLLNQRLKIIDLSADYRLKDPLIYYEWYGKKHKDVDKKFLSMAVYGLPEIYREKIKKAHLVANPGCYPTSIILGLAPLLKNRVVESENIIIDSKSGTTGAGRNLSFALHFSECNENFKAYKVIKHNHIPEIEQELSYIYYLGNQDQEKLKISFTPHLLPISRGILSTCYLNLTNLQIKESEIFEIYENFFQDAPFIRIFKPKDLPEIKYVTGTNYCDIGFKIDERVGKIKVISVIDNLIKGAAGQAVQNMNLMFNFPETTGLIL